MIELTEQQRQELSAPGPVAFDPRTGETYVLVRRETYEHLKALLALDDYDPDEGAGAINEVMAEDDAKDPYLESYQHYGRTGMTRGDIVIVPFLQVIGRLSDALMQQVNQALKAALELP